MSFIQHNIILLGMEICCDVNPRSYVETVIKTASQKVLVPNMVRRFFTPDQLSQLYKR